MRECTQIDGKIVGKSGKKRERESGVRRRRKKCKEGVLVGRSCFPKIAR